MYKDDFLLSRFLFEFVFVAWVLKYFEKMELFLDVFHSIKYRKALPIILKIVLRFSVVNARSVILSFKRMIIGCYNNRRIINQNLCCGNVKNVLLCYQSFFFKLSNFFEVFEEKFALVLHHLSGCFFFL